MQLSEISYYDLYKLGLSSYSTIKIFRRDVIEHNNLKFPENVSISEDLQFTAAYIRLCEKIVFIPIKLYFYYVQNSGSLMNSHHDELMEWNLSAFLSRVDLIGKDNIAEYCDVSLSGFISDFQWTFNHNKTLLQKFQYNSKMLKSNAFQYCLAHCSGKREPPLVRKILKMKNYYLFWMFQQLVNFKRKILK